MGYLFNVSEANPSMDPDQLPLRVAEQKNKNTSPNSPPTGHSLCGFGMLLDLATTVSMLDIPWNL